MALRLTEKSMRQIIETISDQHWAMSGFAVASAAVYAAALAEACMQISLDNQVDRLDWHQVTAQIEQMVHLKNTLIEWCDQDAQIIAEYMALKESEDPLGEGRMFCESPAEISRLCIEAATLLQNFRPLAFAKVQDDLEVAINLLASTAQSALLLLQSQLGRWPSAQLHQEFGPIQVDLAQKIGLLAPKSQIL
jgi:formiminotetrahydrofolate cyclodeaminase